MRKGYGVLLSLASALALVLAVLFSWLSFAPKNQTVIAAKQTAALALLSGGNEADTIALELLPGEFLDINTASALELQKLPGIGEVLSAAIVDYRQEHGDFNSIEDIMNVPGIGEGKYAAIADHITVGE